MLGAVSDFERSGLFVGDYPKKQKASSPSDKQ